VLVAGTGCQSVKRQPVPETLTKQARESVAEFFPKILLDGFINAQIRAQVTGNAKRTSN
jgi:hypothetical protein